jgi:hypothetical protein
MTTDTNIESNPMSASILITMVAKHKPKIKKAAALWNFPKSANSMTALSTKIVYVAHYQRPMTPCVNSLA